MLPLPVGSDLMSTPGGCACWSSGTHPGPWQCGELPLDCAGPVISSFFSKGETQEDPGFTAGATEPTLQLPESHTLASPMPLLGFLRAMAN